MKADAIKIQSLIWPVMFLIGGILTVYANASYGSYQLILIVFFALSVLAIYLLGKKEPYFNWIIGSLILFYGMGFALGTIHNKEYERSSQNLVSASQPIGTVYHVIHYQKMDRIQVRTHGNHWWSPSHYFNINLLDKDHSIHSGQVISVSRPLNRITSSGIPYTFNAQKYWDLHNTSHEVFLYKASDVHILKDSPVPFVERTRQKAANKIDHLYPNDAQAGILKALILGQKGSVSTETKDVFKSAGLMHILAVSGLHVGIVCGLLFVLLLPLKIICPRSSIHYFLMLIALWLYAALTGMNTPVVRAVILATFYLTARRIDRRINKWNVFFWAVLLVLIIQPKAIYAVSFQLSFGAVASILMFYNKFFEWVKPLLGSNYFTGLVAVSLSAQLGIAPLLLLHFQEVSLVSTLSGFFVIPLLFPLILMTSISIILPPSWNWLSELMAYMSSEILDLITGISEMLASWSFSSEVLVWSSLTIGLLLGALLIAGMYQEANLHRTLPWLKKAAVILVILAFISEGHNVYRKRISPVLVKYNSKNQTLSEIYYQGICYTNLKGNAPPFLLRNRKKYYARKMVLMSGVKDWHLLYAGLQQGAKTSPSPPKTNLLIYDYIDQKRNVVDLSLPAKEILKNTGFENTQYPGAIPQTVNFE